MPYTIPAKGSSLVAGPILRALRIGKNGIGQWGFLGIQKTGRLYLEPKGTTLANLPTTCQKGELAVTEVTATARLYICSATNTWTLVGAQV